MADFTFQHLFWTIFTCLTLGVEECSSYFVGMCACVYLGVFVLMFIEICGLGGCVEQMSFRN